MKKERIQILLAVSLLLLCLNCSSPETLPEQGITILSLKTNDIVPAGAPYEIQWKAEVPDSEFGANVTIEFSKDGGKSWEKIEENVSNTGKYSWKVPKIDSAQCKIRINSQYRPKYHKTSEVFTIK